jgi:site-specific DNA-methyltransferase (adenine-specific)
MKPTWERDGVQLYNADCRDVLPSLEQVDCVVTDPPWKTNVKKIKRDQKNSLAKIINPSLGIGYGSIGYFSSDALVMAWNLVRHDMMVICGYKELGEVIDVLKPIRGVFIWHKPNGGRAVVHPAPPDIAYIVWGAKTSKICGHQIWKSSIMQHPIPTAGCISNGERILSEPNGPAMHPAQGPLSLYRQLVSPMKGTVLDCYLGTGTCGVAAVRNGNPFVGIEIEPKYFEIAVKRIEAEMDRFPLLEPKKPKQLMAWED